MNKKYKIPDNVKEIIVEKNKIYALIPKLYKNKLGDWKIEDIKTKLKEIK